MEQTVILERQDDAWLANVGVASKVTGWRGLKAGAVAAQVKALYPKHRIGFKASDLGPATALECIRQGYGNILWLR